MYVAFTPYTTTRGHRREEGEEEVEGEGEVEGGDHRMDIDKVVDGRFTYKTYKSL